MQSRDTPEVGHALTTSVGPEVSASAGPRVAEDGRGPAALGWEPFLQREWDALCVRHAVAARFFFGVAR